MLTPPPNRCFLFLVNYGRMKPEMAQRALPILIAVLPPPPSHNITRLTDTPLIQDMEDPSPLVRALALRTMSYIHVPQFVEATVEPLRILLRDNDPYVRKTAAFCVAKLYDHDRDLVEGSAGKQGSVGLIEGLNGLLKDDNPTVVASALVALMDIWERNENIKLTIDHTNASKIVQILPDCSEYIAPLPPLSPTIVARY